MEQSEFKKQQLELRKLEKEANELVLAYRILPNDQSYQYGKKIKPINVLSPKRLVDLCIKEGQEKYKQNFIAVEKTLTSTESNDKLVTGENNVTTNT